MSDEIPAKMARFAIISDNELDEIIQGKHSKNTKDVISGAVKIFAAYIGEKDIHIPVGAGTVMATGDVMDVPALDSALRRFYAETRQLNGQKYSKKSMITLRYD